MKAENLKGQNLDLEFKKSQIFKLLTFRIKSMLITQCKSQLRIHLLLQQRTPTTSQLLNSKTSSAKANLRQIDTSVRNLTKETFLMLKLQIYLQIPSKT